MTDARTVPGTPVITQDGLLGIVVDADGTFVSVVTWELDTEPGVYAYTLAALRLAVSHRDFAVSPEIMTDILRTFAAELNRRKT
jgi:hypothetical protein